MKTTLSNAIVGDSLSALADGELHGDAIAQTLAAFECDPALLSSWHDYHLIGDVLRSPDLAAVRNSAQFLTRLQSRLAQEAVNPNELLEKSVSVQSARPMPTVAGSLITNQKAVNDPVFFWKMLAGVASMAAVFVMVWTLAVPRFSPGSQLAQGAMVRDSRLEELLAAHKQVGGSSALQMPSGFLRNATFDTSSNARR